LYKTVLSIAKLLPTTFPCLIQIEYYVASSIKD